MKVRNTAIYKRGLSILCAVGLVVSLMPGNANAENISDLQNKSNALENKVSGLSNDLSATSSELDEKLERLSAVTEEIAKTRFELEKTKEEEAKQYTLMEKRIQYMYENGNTDTFELLCNSVSMADFLNKAEYASKTAEYDREMLKNLSDLRSSVEAKEKKLAKEEAELKAIKDNLRERQTALQSQLSETQGELSGVLNDLNSALKAQAEREAELKRKAEEARKEAEKKEAEKKEAEKHKSETPAPQDNTESVPSATAPPEKKPEPKPVPKPKPEPELSSDIDLFAAILEAEAGANYEGDLAVATVIMNRVAHPAYPNSIKGVVYQSGQFSPSWNGSLNRILRRGAHSTCYAAARDALAGKRNSKVSHCYQFRASFTNHPGILVGGNVFF